MPEIIAVMLIILVSSQLFLFSLRIIPCFHSQIRSASLEAEAVTAAAAGKLEASKHLSGLKYLLSFKVI
jgi:hypothetical protein